MQIQDSKIQEYFKAYEKLLLKWNTKHNLGGNLDSALIQSYITESVYPLEFITPFSSCMDVGSGAGFPAIPLAIACEESSFILIEPRKKRSAFLHTLRAELGLKNIHIIPKRLEELEECAQVDLITSRALMSTQELIQKSRHLLKKGGAFLFYKGSQLEEELGYDISHFQKLNQRVYFYQKLEECK